MPPKVKPYEQFGPFILFRKFESNPLGDIWRAAKIDGQQLGELFTIHRLSGGNREGIRRSVEWARPIAPSISGTTVARRQMIDIIDGIPFVAHEYTSGRSLSYVVEKSRGGAGNPNPVPVDQALAVVDKVANSLETINNMKYSGNRLVHGALIPQFVWIESDGEIRVSGQQIGKGFLVSLSVPDFQKAFSPYFAPEIRDSQQATKASDVFSLGGLLYLLLTGSEPPDALDPQHAEKIAAAKMIASGEPVPADIMPLLKKATALDPSKRYPSATEFRGAISPLVNGGTYTATTFNLAFYLSSLLRKELDSEATDREKESKLPLAPYLEDVAPAAMAAASAARPAAAAAPLVEEKKSKMPLIAAAAVAVVAIGAAGAYFAFRKPAPAPAAVAAPATTSASTAPKTTIQPIIESVSTSTAPASATLDPAAQKKAFEDAVNKKLQEEMMALQQDYNKQLEQTKKPETARVAEVLPRAATPAPAPAKPAAQPSETRPEPSAAALDQQRLQGATATSSPQPAAQAPVPQPAAAASPAVQEGDVVAMDVLDEAPRVTKRVPPVYPQMAAQRKIQARVILSVLVAPSGSVDDVRVLRGDSTRMGFDEAAIRAVRGWKFSPAVKDGKRVRVWIPIAVDFKM